MQCRELNIQVSIAIPANAILFPQAKAMGYYLTYLTGVSFGPCYNLC